MAATMVELVRETCIRCYIEFGMPSTMQAELRRNHCLFYCPSGHGMSYTGQSEEEKLRLERDRLKQQIAQKDDEVLAARIAKDDAEKETARIKKRVNKGMCTCCRRTFPNLAQHMATSTAMQRWRRRLCNCIGRR